MRRGRHVAEPKTTALCLSAPVPHPPGNIHDMHEGISGFQKAADSSTLFFEPFETKRWLYEFKVASDLSEFHVIPGSYSYRGGYAWHWTAFDTITVTP